MMSLIVPYVILQTDLCGEIYKAKQLQLAVLLNVFIFQTFNKNK